MGRAFKEINWDLVDMYLKTGATQKEIAKALFIHPDTLRDNLKQKYGEDYSTYSSGVISEGQLHLRVAQYQKAIKSSSPGNTQMLIWLGKVLLGQKEPDSSSLEPANDEINEIERENMKLKHLLSLREDNGNKS